ncbi:sugar phosphate isomerase/epimerase family protein [Flavihumibacter profundi]|uniref:sugar phosphate isomerase/epimerase family protein n=1 Tax=Flavihumibacter profundi TaxID=2716883 RepID=UPI001CC5DC33|nr:sugar phosphate isomerase/epimerase family protein [Flavihumibacter profundi]MBZ5856666.1 sugar phosphate isomerase/epimerase [Flavihumibacter profundi]
MINRKLFIRQSALFAGGLLIGSGAFAVNKEAPLLSFSTLGCPKWSIEQILSFGSANGYEGIEIRGILGELNLPKLPAFSSAASIASTRKMFADKNLKIVNLGASAEMHHVDPAKRKKNIDEAKQFIDLAYNLGCPFVRVFPNELPKDRDRAVTLDLIVSGLKELGDYAKGSSVTVLMETHGDLSKTEDVLYLMQHSEGPHVGLVWDIYNMWTVTNEPPAQVYAKLHSYIRHTHIKDSKKTDGKENYVFLGRGDAPLTEAFAALRNGGYKGFYSFEWEKLWHPEIAEPELAIADFPSAFKKIYNSHK